MLTIKIFTIFKIFFIVGGTINNEKFNRTRYLITRKLNAAATISDVDNDKELKNSRVNKISSLDAVTNATRRTNYYFNSEEIMPILKRSDDVYPVKSEQHRGLPFRMSDKQKNAIQSISEKLLRNPQQFLQNKIKNLKGRQSELNDTHRSTIQIDDNTLDRNEDQSNNIGQMLQINYALLLLVFSAIDSVSKTPLIWAAYPQKNYDMELVTGFVKQLSDIMSKQHTGVNKQTEIIKQIENFMSKDLVVQFSSDSRINQNTENKIQNHYEQQLLIDEANELVKEIEKSRLTEVDLQQFNAIINILTKSNVLLNKYCSSIGIELLEDNYDDIKDSLITILDYQQVQIKYFLVNSMPCTGENIQIRVSGDEFKTELTTFLLEIEDFDKHRENNDGDFELILKKLWKTKEISSKYYQLMVDNVDENITQNMARLLDMTKLYLYEALGKNNCSAVYYKYLSVENEYPILDVLTELTENMAALLTNIEHEDINDMILDNIAEILIDSIKAIIVVDMELNQQDNSIEYKMLQEIKDYSDLLYVYSMIRSKHCLNDKMTDNEKSQIIFI